MTARAPQTVKLRLLYLALAMVLILLVYSFSHLSPTPTSTAPPNETRRLLIKGIEGSLLRAGFDVQVTFIAEDDSRMIIYGKSVNRSFAYNLISSPEFKKSLHDGKFTQVTFQDSLTFPSFFQVYQVK